MLLSPPPIVVSTVGSPSLQVLKASIQAYTPQTELIVYQGSQTNFGDAYNAALTLAFEKHNSVLIANDDVVLHPDTIPTLMEDVAVLTKWNKVGFVACRSDFVRRDQDIRFNNGDFICPAYAISPIFAWLSREAFQESWGFPPLNWYSDDVICYDMEKLGYKHFISKSYIHHVGSNTIGHDHKHLTEAAKPWIMTNRPDYYKLWFPQP